LKNIFTVIFIAFYHQTCFASGASPLTPPNKETIIEAKSIISEMIKIERGPYSQIRWFCNNGVVLPPKAYACKDQGGGHQHAQYSSQRQRLAELGWNVGTIFTPMSWDELWDEDNRHQRLRELALERYMTDIDNGWVLQRAKHYRGRIQLEDEEEAGNRLLLQLLEDSDWVRQNYLLTKEAIKVIPHNYKVDLTRSIRRISQEIAEKDNRFQKLRVEIHTSPSPSTVTRVREWVEKYKPINADTLITTKLNSLVTSLELLYSPTGRQQRLKSALDELSSHPQLAQLADNIPLEPKQSALVRLDHLSNTLYAFKLLIISDLDVNLKLSLFDIYPDIEEEIRLSATDIILDEQLTRHELLHVALALLRAASAAGLVSENELNTTSLKVNKYLATDDINTKDYFWLAQSLSLANNWAIGSVRHTFAEAINRYNALDPRAGRFLDDIIRGSVLLPYANAIKRLTLDAQLKLGIKRSVMGKPSSTVLGLNPGVARGTLKAINENQLHADLQFSRNDIVLLPYSVTELPPVSGVITLGEGNLLSHVQLLARNFGIPNASISDSILSEFTPYLDKEIIYIVGSDGTVLIESIEKLNKPSKDLLDSYFSTQETTRLDVPLPDLTVTKPITIDNLHKGLSGKIVGPKAANLGELNRLFPGKVSPAIALPFGIFSNHVNTKNIEFKSTLKDLYTKFRSNVINESEFNTAIDNLRQKIESVQLNANTLEELNPLMDQLFGNDEDYGLFIRSDTNVEDLPGFTGAGLSLTLANLRGKKTQIDSIPQVWASVLSPRAIAWRSNLLEQPEEVYASVLLMKSVAAKKSGVVVTRDLYTNQDGFTVSTSWGIGGAVSGEAAETLVILNDGTSHLISEAKAPYQRKLSKQNGISWIPADAGKILQANEIEVLRQLTIDVANKYPAIKNSEGVPLPWDIEFGFVDNKLTLFQIRPLVERGSLLADRLLKEMLDINISPNNSVKLTDAIIH
jgi:hypothetical protein